MFDKSDVRSGLLAAAPSPPQPPAPSLSEGGLDVSCPTDLGKELWWNEVPERQSTTGSTISLWNESPSEVSRQVTSVSTTASEADYRDYRLPAARNAPYSPWEARDRRLAAVRERRGWKHYFKHVVGVPLAFTAGISTGMIVTTAAVVNFSRAPGGASKNDELFHKPPVVAAQAPYATVPPPAWVPESYMLAAPLDNSCLVKNLAIPEGPQTFDACKFVIESTDAVWNLRGDVEAAIEKYFHEEYLDAGSWGRRIVGKQALREAILSEMRAFPDIKIHITDCVCKGNDLDGYKCAMPDVLTGTNLGPSAYGPPTGRFARWTGLVESLVKKNPATGQWQYYAEWGVHDEWALIQQLGLDFQRVPRPLLNNEPLHDCSPLVRFGPAPTMDQDDVADQKWHEKASASKSLV